MTELAWVPFVILILAFAGYVAEHWPRRSPFEDMAHEDRRATDQAHKP